MTYSITTLPLNKGLQPWLKELDSCDYWARRRFLWTRIRPKLPRFLYKYKALHYPKAREDVRDLLVGSVLRLGCPKDFNDPFDMDARVVMDATVEQRRARFKALIREQSPGMPWKAQEAAIQTLMSAKDETLIGVCQGSLDLMRHTTGVYCFASNATNTLMWSHYAYNHTGICLQFERVKDYRTLLHAMPVEYREDRPKINWVVGFHKSIGEALFVKHPCWRYEGESRIVALERAGRYIQFRPEALRSIVFGCRVSPDDVAFIDSLLAERAELGYPPVKMYAALQHPTKFQIKVRMRGVAAPNHVA